MPLPSMFGHFSHPNCNRPIPAQKWILKQQVPLNALKAQHENQLPMYKPLPSPRQSHSQNDPKTLPGPRPSLLAASTVAPAEISCSTTAAWPFSAASCSGVSPRAPRMRRGRRGQQWLPSRNKAYSHGMFLQVVGKNSEYIPAASNRQKFGAELE